MYWNPDLVKYIHDNNSPIEHRKLLVINVILSFLTTKQQQQQQQQTGHKKNEIKKITKRNGFMLLPVPVCFADEC